MDGLDLQSLGQRLGEAITPTPTDAPQVRYATIAAVNGDGTLDITIDGATLRGVAATTGCVGARVDMRCVVLRQGPLATVVGLVASTDLGDIYLAHNKRIYGTNSNSEPKYVFEPRNASDNCAINYPGYSESNSSTDIFGNNISLQARDRITFNSQTAYPNGTALPDAGNTTDFYAIGINAFARGGIVKYKGLADVKTWLGMGSVDYTNSSWVTPKTGCHYRKRAGWVVVVFDGVTWNGTGDATYITLPAGYRPGKKINLLSVNGSNANVYMYVSTDGVLKFHRTSSSNSTYYNGVMVFPADN